MRLGMPRLFKRFAFTSSTPSRVVSLLFGSGFATGSSFASFYYYNGPDEFEIRDSKNDEMHMYIVRHGESEGNVDLSAYTRYGDHKLPLTDDGKLMAQRAGKFLSERFEEMFQEGEEPWIEMWVSPFTRTRETAIEMLQGGLGGWVKHVRESPHLVEQDWGLMEGMNIRADEVYEHFPANMKRIRLQADAEGKFYARFPAGESVADVYNRVTNFVGSINRKKTKYAIVVTHGITGRALIMRMLHHTPEWFESSVNLPNASIYEISKVPNEEKSTKVLWNANFIYGGFGKDGLEHQVDVGRLNRVNDKCSLRSMKKAMQYEKYLEKLGTPRVFESLKRPCRTQIECVDPELDAY